MESTTEVSKMKGEQMTFPPLSDSPLVSILMPAFNAEKYVESAIRSTLDQTHQNWELLILDDASTDNTGEIVKSFNDSRIRRFKNEQNKGYLLSCNNLFTKVKGELLTFLDADDIQFPDRLKICVQTFKSDDKLGFLTTNHVRISPDGNALSEKKSKVDYERYATDPEYFPYLACATIMLRKELLNTVGGYHPFFIGIGGEDYHWLFKLASNALGTHLSESFYGYRQHIGQNQNRLNNPLSYFFPEIINEIRSGLLVNQVDLLLQPALLNQRWMKHLKDEPYKLELRKAQHQLNRNERKKGLVSGIKLLGSSVSHPKAWLDFFRLLYLARPIQSRG